MLSGATIGTDDDFFGDTAMNLMLNLPADLEATIKKHAEEAGLGLADYVLRTLRLSDTDVTVLPTLSEEQFAASLKRLCDIHTGASTTFDDSRESIYEGCGE